MCKYCEIPDGTKLYCHLVLRGQYDSFDTIKGKYYKVNYSTEVGEESQLVKFCPLCGQELRQ